jgi:hypothetical protein
MPQSTSAARGTRLFGYGLECAEQGRLWTTVDQALSRADDAISRWNLESASTGRGRRAWSRPTARMPLGTSEAVSWIGSGTAPRWYTEGLPRKAPSSDPGGGACLCSQESHPHAKIRPSPLSQRRQRGRMCRRSRREGRETRRTRVPQDAPREIERPGAPLQPPETSDPRRSARPRERRCAASARRLGRAAIAADAARIRN